MPPRSPLPQRHGLDPAWLRTPNRVPGKHAVWSTMGQWLREKLPPEAGVDALLHEGRFVYSDAQVLRASDPYLPHTFVWFHRELRDEPIVPGTIDVLYRSDRFLIIDKPPFLSTIPRGRHIQQSVVVRLRDALQLPALTPAHRLDRVTSGLILLTVERQWRGAYQSLFQQRIVDKTYHALAPLDPTLTRPVTVRNHIHKEHGIMAATVLPDAEPNAHSIIALESERENGVGCYRLTPITGRTHQLRLHMHALGLPIINDPLYPEVRDVSIDDFSHPLQLLASGLAFTDPIDGTRHEFVSRRSLPL